MNIFYSYNGRYSGFKDSVLSARTMGGCPVHVMTDQKDYIRGAIVEDQNQLPVPDDVRNIFQYQINGLLRWLAISRFVKKNSILGTIVVFDWDFLLFSNLTEALEPFSAFPLCNSKEVDSSWNAAWVIRDQALLHDFIPFTFESIRKRQCGDECVQYNDMAMWNLFIYTHQIPHGNLSDIKNNSVFDHNLHCGHGKYECDGMAKKITWKDKRPYFTLLDGTMIKAHTIHCWGPSKGKTSELITLSGIGNHDTHRLAR